MNSPHFQASLHRFAVLTACLALCFPVILGAQTTTKSAGMAFPDWPSSDGYPMLTYPWFLSTGDKFLEHGHRLAGAMIGVVSIILAVLFWRKESRRWVRMMAYGVLGAVIVQGLLGGNRVLMNDSRMAFAHGMFAALVFSLMIALSQVTSRGWMNSDSAPIDRDPGSLKAWAILLPLVIFGQYFLGGLLRHLGTALHEHMGMAVIAMTVLFASAVIARRSGQPWIQQTAWSLALLTLVQVALGFGAFVTKFGFKATGYVAVHQAPLQVMIRTSHTVMGMLLFMSATLFAIRVLRVCSIWNARHPDPLANLALSHDSTPTLGGAR